MKNVAFGLFALFVCMACHPVKELTDRTYKFESNKRTLSITFNDDSTCVLQNTFHCSDIDANVREIAIRCRFQQVGDRIYLRNLDCQDDNCRHNLTVDIPPQQSSKCDFLSDNSRRSVPFSPKYNSQYEKFGLVPDIDIDTLYIIKNKIILTKAESGKSVGFIFK